MSYTDKISAMRGDLRALNKAMPEAAKGFGALSRAAHDGTALGAKEKELIALGIAVATRCEPCIMFHVEALMKTGATREELADMLAIAVQMGGGPSLMYSGKALACWDEFAAKG